MTLRANYIGLAPDAMKLLMAQENYLRQQFTESDILTTKVWELVKLRVSQINQCAFCIDMHSKEALSAGENTERILGLNAWRDMPLYSEIENVALEWAESLTLGKPIDDPIYQHTVSLFGEKTVVNLTIAINAINSWNRIAKTFKQEVGSYKP
ncbi:carboxymuconolactone decarboxylase family protein [Vibrio salinus]|uniref:carboxymuconolactone decarboxylase family protein n=1 Tax=Vibrio salinus TaxID=2899784 RepID=UPI001E5768A5|nr:carboxymuconolactone decarboxylase family protein [Vibrio salinus]MCE0492455.1 carboxymuconolactone decarboxylase family protein [Vibrio salinus]